MKSLGDVLHEWKPSAEVSRDPLSLIAHAWQEIVGEKIAANSRPQQIDRDTLLVVTRSNAWSQQLSFLSEKIIAALRERGVQPTIINLRFRAGRIAQSLAAPRAAKKMPEGSPKGIAERAPSVDTSEAFARFRADVEAAQRAKQAAGWKPCSKCGAFVAPSSGTLCSTCADARSGEREGLVERLLYETPWLGYDGIAQFVEGLTRAEYTGVRHRLLTRWWDTLRRAERAGRLSRDGRERLIASSYVLLKSGIAPEVIAPATVRNLLGDELHALIYGSTL